MKTQVAIVGAGPAGLAAATTLADRGHEVELFEARDHVGGQFDIAMRIPGKEEFAETIRYFSRQLDLSGVKVHLGRTVDAGELADAGFDEFIRRQWQPLVAGQPVALDFAVPSRLESIGFTAKRVGSARVGGEDAWIFRLRLGGLLGYVVPSIDVFYGQASRRLLRFQGLSNLRNDAGESPLNARIDFPTPPRGASAAQWQAGLRLPLVTCRTGR